MTGECNELVGWAFPCRPSGIIYLHTYPGCPQNSLLWHCRMKNMLCWRLLNSSDSEIWINTLMFVFTYLLSLKKICFIFLHIYFCVYIVNDYEYVWVCFRTPGSGVIGGCPEPSVVSSNKIRVLCKNKFFYSVNPLSSHKLIALKFIINY
jgi:hypothetical protein